MTRLHQVVEKQFLTALVNRIFKKGRQVVTITTPLIDSPLLAVDRNFDLYTVIRPPAYNKGRGAIVGRSAIADREMPTWSDVVQALSSSGAFPPRNWKAFLDFVSKSGSRNTSSQRLPKPFTLCIDTNVAYNRLFSRHLTGTTRKDFALSILISQGVRDEVDHHIGPKVTRTELRELYSRSSDDQFLLTLGNRNALRTRKGKLAQNELDHLKSKYRALTIRCEPFHEDGRQYDVVIARSYEEAAQAYGVDACLVTFDQNMADHAKNVGLPTFVLETSTREQYQGISVVRALPALLHDLAVLFGVVRIQPFDIFVWGEWGGKTSADYEEERVMVELDECQPIAPDFLRDVKTSSELIQILRGSERV